MELVDKPPIVGEASESCRAATKCRTELSSILLMIMVSLLFKGLPLNNNL